MTLHKKSAAAGAPGQDPYQSNVSIPSSPPCHNENARQGEVPEAAKRDPALTEWA